MGFTLSNETFNNLHSIISEYTEDGSKISIEDLAELSGLALSTLKNNAAELEGRFPDIRRSFRPSMIWIDSGAEVKVEEQKDMEPTYARFVKKSSALESIISYIEEHSTNGEKISSSEILDAMHIARHTFHNVSSEISRRNPKIKSDGGTGGKEKRYWIEKEIDMPKEKPVENIMTTSPILDDDQICTPGEIWTEKGTADAHGYDKRKWLIAAAVGHTVQALEVRTSEKGYNGMRDIWIDKAGICYLAPRLLRQMSDSQLDQYVATAPDDVMDKVRDKLRDIFGIKPVEVEKIVEVPVEVEKIVEKTVKVPVEVEKIVEVEKKENPGDISISKLEFELLKQRASIYESITKSLLARREVG